MDYQTPISLLTNFVVMVQSVRHLDVAIDMHISLVQMRQNVRAGLAEGKELRQVLRRCVCISTRRIGKALQDWMKAGGETRFLSSVSRSISRGFRDRK